MKLRDTKLPLLNPKKNISPEKILSKKNNTLQKARGSSVDKYSSGYYRKTAHLPLV